MLAHISG